MLQVVAERICNPSSDNFFNWASIFSSQGGVYLSSGCNGLGIASYLGLADLVERFPVSVKGIDAYQTIYPACLTKYTALKIAIGRGFPDVVRVLLQRGADSSLQDEYGNGPLHEALHANLFAPPSDRLAILEMLFESGLHINSKILRGHTPLYHASLLSSEDVVELLVKHDAKLEAPTGYSNWTPLQEAVLLGDEHQAAILLKYGADFKAHTNSEHRVFRAAGKSGSFVMCWCQSRSEGSADSTEQIGGSALHIAAYTARANIVDLLLKQGADVNAFGGNHGTALIAACSAPWQAAERQKTVRILIKNNAEIHAMGTLGGNAIEAASFNGQSEIVALLLLKGQTVIVVEVHMALP